jgi:hypothetical protein
MIDGKIPEATPAAEVLFRVVQPLWMGWKFGSLAMVKELFFCRFACKLPCIVKYTARNIQGEKGFYAGPS